MEEKARMEGVLKGARKTKPKKIVAGQKKVAKNG
jgi:hypothetical protein